MSFLKKIFKSPFGPPSPDKQFWQWFAANEKQYRNFSSKPRDEVDALLTKLIDQVRPYNEWLKCLLGATANGKNELIITADGDVALFTKVEDLIAAAPNLSGWVFTAHKPATGMGISIQYEGKEFSPSTLSFYPVFKDNMPDEISIVVTHPKYTSKEKDFFKNACYIYLENALGELAVAVDIDELNTGAIPPADTEIIPIEKLPGYITWRKKEFVEKYNELQAEPLADNWNLLQATTANNTPLFVLVKSNGNDYDYKPVYPWSIEVQCKFNGDEKGLPGKNELAELQALEEKISKVLADEGSSLHVATETFDNCRTLFYYTSNFTAASAALHVLIETGNFANPVSFFVVKDKYWQKVSHYYENLEED